MSRNARLVLGLGFGIAAQLSAIGLLLTASWLIVRAAQHPPVLYLMVAVVAVRFFGISRSVFRYVERLLTHDVAFQDGIAHRLEIHKELDRVAPAGLGAQRRGDLVSRIVGDVVTIQDRLLRIRVPWITGIVATATVVILIGWLDFRSGLVLCALALVLALAIRWVISPISASERIDTAQVRGELSAEVVGAAIAASELVALDTAEESQQRARNAATALADDQERAAASAGSGGALVLTGIGLGVAMISSLTDTVDPVLVGVLILAPMVLAEAWDGWVEAERFRPGVEQAENRLAALAQIPDPVAEPMKPVRLSDDATLTVHDLVAGWNEPLFEPVSFSVAPSEIIGISGPSGIGKSTLAHVILRFLDPLRGRVELGGIDIRDLLAADVRKVIGYVAQDEVVFDTSVRENLRVANPDASDDELYAVIRAVGLSPLIDSLADGLDGEVGPDGTFLSGGERQRLCIARLMLSGHRIWIVDEPSEHLDAPTSTALLDDLEALARSGIGGVGRGLVLISHSPAVLARCDRVISLVGSGLATK